MKVPLVNVAVPKTNVCKLSTPPMATVSELLLAAKPPLAVPLIHCTCPAPAPRLRVNVPLVCSTPPLSTRLLAVGRLLPSWARNTPVVIVVTPV